MSELERRALLGDRQAQKECTRQGIVLPYWAIVKYTHKSRTNTAPEHTSKCFLTIFAVTLNRKENKMMTKCQRMGTAAVLSQRMGDED